MIICDIIRFFFKDKKEKNIQPEDNFNDFEPPCIWCDIGECKCFQAKNGIPRCDEIQQRYCSGEKTRDIFPDFYVDPSAIEYFDGKKGSWEQEYRNWTETLETWGSQNAGLRKEWKSFFSAPDVAAANMPVYQTGDAEATRNAGNAAQIALADAFANIVGGSADLAGSNKTAMPDLGQFSKADRSGRTINFGVREHAMGGVTNGLALHGGLRPFAATFLVFADYMRPPIRLAALMKLPVIYVLTHDSIYVGEDGPTHQPVEQVESLRIIPGLTVLRPADAEETNVAWQMGLERADGPTAIALTRQNLPVFDKADEDWISRCRRGAYTAVDCDGAPEVVVVATGSEVSMAIEAAKSASGKKVRVVSMISRKLFEAQDTNYKSAIIPPGARVIVAEAGVGSGWGGIASSTKDILSIDAFGESGKAAEVAKQFGMTAANLAKIIDR